jgi:hypothetical protein
VLQHAKRLKSFSAAIITASIITKTPLCKRACVHSTIAALAAATILCIRACWLVKSLAANVKRFTRSRSQTGKAAVSSVQVLAKIAVMTCKAASDTSIPAFGQKARRIPLSSGRMLG